MNNDVDDFESRSGALLEAFMEVIDEALGDVLEVDLESGILTIELDAGGHYIINKHAPTGQIWMSSPSSGATHFNFDAQTRHWVNSRGTEKLTDMLAAELAKATGKTVTFDR